MMDKDESEILTINRSAIFFLPSLYIIIHTLEEIPSFAAWVETYFGSHPTTLFASQHILIWLLIFLFSYKAYQRKRHSRWVIMAVAAQIQFGLNALFHLTTYFIFMTYSPGMITGAAVGIPGMIWLLRIVLREDRLNGRELAWASLWGAIIAVAAVSVLFLQ